jgi:hypothetical protein
LTATRSYAIIARNFPTTYLAVLLSREAEGPAL